MSRESVLRKLDLQRENTITELSGLFEHPEPATQQPEEFGVWTVTGHEAVTSRLLECIDDAEEELVYMTVDELLTDDHLDRLAAAEERGVDVYLAGLSEPVQAEIRKRAPRPNSSRRCGPGPRRESGACSSPTSGPPS